MPRKPSRKTLVRKLDKVFSEYIRKRDTDKNGYGLCCTCAKRIHYKEGHAGHFMSRRHYSTRWDEDNVALQCVSCNSFHGGRQYEFALFLNDKYKSEKATELLIKSRETVKYSLDELEDMIKYFKNLLT